MDKNAILDLPIKDEDSGANSIRQYLKMLLWNLWNEKEGFDAKRPFGNSGWDYNLFIPLIKFGVIDGSFDKYGYINKCDWMAGELIIFELIEYIFHHD